MYVRPYVYSLSWRVKMYVRTYTRNSRRTSGSGSLIADASPFFSASMRCPPSQNNTRSFFLCCKSSLVSLSLFSCSPAYNCVFTCVISLTHNRSRLLLDANLSLAFRKQTDSTMGIRDAAEAAAEDKVYEKGGYPALIQYKCARFYKAYCGCCG